MTREVRPSPTRGDAGARRPHVHYHTDSSWFAGCETMLVNLLSDPELLRDFDVSLSYRESARYTAGLRRRMTLEFPVHPLRFVDPSHLVPVLTGMKSPIGSLGRFLSRQIATGPALVHEILVLRRLFRRIRPDILHINNGGFPGALSARAAAIAGRLAGVPHVLMVINNLAVGYESAGRKLEYALDQAVARSVTRFISGSAAAAERLRAVLGLATERALPLNNGALLREPTESPMETRHRIGLREFRGTIFGIVALMEPRKGHRVLLQAVDRMVGQARGDANDFRLVLLGDGMLRAELEAWVATRGLQQYCLFLGEEENAMNVIGVLDVLVLSSVAHEDFPNVILEAMGAGKAVIASRIAGTPEQVVEGETGLLTEPGDVGALADAMTRLRRDVALRQQMGRAARRRFESCFTARVSVARYTALYRSLLAAPQPVDFARTGAA